MEFFWNRILSGNFIWIRKTIFFKSTSVNYSNFILKYQLILKESLIIQIKYFKFFSKLIYYEDPDIFSLWISNLQFKNSLFLFFSNNKLDIFECSIDFQRFFDDDKIILGLSTTVRSSNLICQNLYMGDLHFIIQLFPSSIGFNFYLWKHANRL